MIRLALFLFLGFFAVSSQAEKSAELYLLLEGTERFQKNVLDLEAELLELEQTQQLPRSGRVSVHFSTALDSKLKLESLTLKLNELEPVQHQYNSAQRQAFNQGGTQLAHIDQLPPGKHRLVAEFTVWHKEKKLLGRRIVDFDHGKNETWVELLLEDIPGEIFEGQPEKDAKRRIELSSRIWEAPQ